MPEAAARPARVGIVLCNLGTPAQATPAAVRRFLGPFLSDQRVVELPRVLWWPILYGLILPLRSRRVAKAYQAIWWEEGSPLQVISERQQAGLQNRFADGSVQVELAMSYSSPSLQTAMDKLMDAGAERIIVLPLYPQYSATTTASIYDQLAEYFRKHRKLPAVDIIRDYHEHPAYIKALADSIRGFREKNPGGDKLVMSFHGIPRVNVDKGDPYQQQCERTAQLIAQELQLSGEDWCICYQSRFGRQEWLQPYTAETLQALGEQSASVDLVCPAFSADCLETLEEIAVENRNLFLQVGGKQFQYIPCLNDSDAHIDLFYSLVKKKI